MINKYRSILNLYKNNFNIVYLTFITIYFINILMSPTKDILGNSIAIFIMTPVSIISQIFSNQKLYLILSLPISRPTVLKLIYFSLLPVAFTPLVPYIFFKLIGEYPNLTSIYTVIFANIIFITLSLLLFSSTSPSTILSCLYGVTALISLFIAALFERQIITFKFSLIIILALLIISYFGSLNNFKRKFILKGDAFNEKRLTGL